MYKLAVLNTHPIQYFAPLYRRLAQESDIDLTVYFCSHQGSAEYLDEGFGEKVKWDVSLLDGYKHTFLANLRAREQVGGFWSLINPSIISEIREKRYDALIVNGHNHATYLLAMFAAKAVGTRVMMRCDTHMGLKRSVFKRVLRKPLMSFLYKQLCDICLPIGSLNKEFYLSHGVDEKRLINVPFAVDNDFFMAAVQRREKDQLRRQLDLPLDAPIVLFASKLLPRKRPMDLLMAFERLQRKGIKGCLVFVGSGDEEKTLRNYALDQQIRNVKFCGFQNQSELPGLYANSDIFVLPSENEPWGLILNEVMCAAMPVVVAKGIGAVPDLVHHEKNGFVFDTGNIEQLSNFISSLLQSETLRAQMGAESFRLIQHWSYDSCTRGIRSALACGARSTRGLAEEQTT